MALKDVFKPKTKTAKDSTARFVGMKLKNEDADELATLVGLEAGTGGADIFKAMVAKLIGA